MKLQAIEIQYFNKRGEPDGRIQGEGESPADLLSEMGYERVRIIAYGHPGQGIPLCTADGLGHEGLRQRFVPLMPAVAEDADGQAVALAKVVGTAN